MVGTPAPAPGVVIAATSSGSGKTTIATGLIRALSASMKVAPFKVGPDYIDPGYHGLAAGGVGRNLDSVMCGAQRMTPMYAHGAQGADIAVVEGVMGLFDGRIPAQGQHQVGLAQGSTAEIAALLGLPVVLVVDVRGMSQSVGAVVHGFASHSDQVQVAGVILNKVGTPRHAEVCTQAVEAYGIPVLGAIPRVDDAEVPSRHLGLVTTGELGGVTHTVDSMAQMVSQHVDLDALVALARSDVQVPAWDPKAEVGNALPQGSVRIAMAGGPAFSFTYAEHVELLRAAGAEVIDFDPLSEPLPECSGLIIPGGFPEEHCAQLAANTQLREHVRARIAEGMPVHAECAGLLWLLEALDGHEMLGVIPTSAAMGRRLTLGYREAVALHDSLLYQQGERILGHEFHHTALEAQHLEGFAPAWGWRAFDGSNKQEGFIQGNVHASYLHVHPASTPQAIRRFVQACHAAGEGPVGR
ncbi:cobyrinate a,c-diamide synthase [Corynebacterium sp. 153RC1]|uniref:cobyrinate a,c-diamide synthase n=1 Tax=unclassified Corynebacterium TaxID=2624378 RepID=UPI00211CB669|nr:cobyrinate a,c-diamide synthase [Corynebacterium sp. 209RC1]MCQ9353980.1 cobyrinate a,c-diamide synthase [Corynebacterium sp. 1222RC1]MCQ9355894.1 cobyrinate a,c-diamide synthase [Corynebacterium sp. 122RC1]MCQ9358138.1 cobyrinate a,c-diamide synthase [Corynebacterium sp. 142RC1]MCQ9360258.1 cobyrinate a,c-diamide synthase [Corynebacterium sp. 153RC1]MCQ9362422.1 cobyrinate a,c-diamide synthase [Corynebacterium sp. 732RC1]MCQ9364878.1 cobyrinate a,c-diamide synthase [Corynebacterium sp. 70